MMVFLMKRIVKELENELNFTNEKPYVIYGYAGVASKQNTNS